MGKYQPLGRYLLSFMRLTVLASLSVLVASVAFARDLRHPVSGDPSFTITVPDGWESSVVAGGRTLAIWSPDRRIGIVLFIGRSSGPADSLIDELVSSVKGTQLEAKAGSIAGLAGRTYSYVYLNKAGVRTHAIATVVQIATSIAFVETLVAVDSSPETRELVESVVRTVRLK